MSETDLLYDSEQWAPTPDMPGTFARMAPEFTVVGEAWPCEGDGLGGAAGVAAALTALGAKTGLVSVCTRDQDCAPLRARLAERGAGAPCLVVESGRWASVAGSLSEMVRETDCVLVCDRTGSALAAYASRLISADRGHLPPVAVYTGDTARWSELRPELMAVSGQGSGDSAAARLVRLHDRGMTLTVPRRRPYRTWARPPHGRRAGAAEESGVAALALGLVAGLPSTTSAELAQAAADVTACLPDPLVCGTELLTMWLRDRRSVFVPWQGLAPLVHGHERAGRRVVVVGGVFDRLRLSDVDRLNTARQQGDVLVVAVRSDAMVRRAGNRLPIRRATDRAETPSTLSCVDHVTIAEGGAVPLGLP
ncbi:ADP-heptose synthase, bifunctional sugar kinase/adenylyltransferase [Amycolatopsis xylanica]|uniref:ADP-heptose synthase, bifunctional sugar kinase/adenylyltransferase n=1 Tax=Amycolatopsis xylanica TaxID=589385 RepID=A0A1H2VYV6_9PSEU|nr:hypothetical protein [Amycolatopsis xylanica]SDW73535.1 ADP-heptose synthase, bifunctional sugar kinase/adenylyltransferase [Amycolatopsis xylanica]